jgi:hypothetical protein
MFKTTMVCDFCARTEEHGNQDGWAVVEMMAGTPKPARHLCPTCVARAEGWKGERGVGAALVSGGGPHGRH